MAGIANLVILIEPDEAVRSALSTMLRQHGWNIETTERALDLAALLEQRHPHLVVAESSLADSPAAETLEVCKSAGVPVIFLGHGRDIQEAVDLMRKGAFDYLEKPFPQQRLLSVMEEVRTGAQT